MTYDNTDTNADGAIDAPVDNDSVSTDELTNVYDHVTNSPKSTIENDLTEGESVAIGPGTYSISLDSNDEGITISQNDVTIWLHPDATIKLADSQTASDTDGGLIKVANGVSGVTIEGHGALDGNKVNNTSPSDVSLFGLIRFNDNVSNLEITGIKIKNSPGDAIRGFASNGSEATDIDIHHLRWEDCVEGVLWTHVDSVQLSHFVARNMTQQDAVEPVRSEDFLISDFYIDTAEQSGIDVFDSCSTGRIENGTIQNVSQSGNEAGIGIGGNNGTCTDITISNVDIFGSNGVGARVRSGGDHDNINFRDVTTRQCAGDGYQIGSGVVNLYGCAAIANDGNGISHQGHDSEIIGGTIRNNSQASAGSEDGIEIIGNNVTVEAAHIFDDQSTPTQRLGIRDSGSDARLNGLTINGHDLRAIGGGGTRTRWNGVMFGGPMGGVDLTTVTGLFEGDQAMSNGTNTTAYTVATWTGSAWQPSDGGATI